VRSNLRLQTELAAAAVREAVASVREGRSSRFRVVQYSIQDKHFHAIVEASSTSALVSGVRSLVIRIARQVNRAVHRRGQVWADRWQGHALETPRAVRDALVTLFSGRGKRPGSDPFSSAACFGGFLEQRGRTPSAGADSAPVSPSRTELLGSWKRLGLIAHNERPKTS
jgi:REP element-mobilizing transposase RayT